MKCKKCGCDTLIKQDDWYKCANCGAEIFDTEINVNEVTNPTKIVDDIESDSADTNPPSEDTQQKKSKKKEKEKKSPLRDAIEFCIPIVIAIILAIVLKTCVFANAVVPTGSMLNTIQEGDRIIASRLAYINEDPERYDVVIFKFPDDEKQFFVKRIVGLPGETVEVVNGIVYVTKTDGSTIQLDDDFVTNCTPTGDFGPFVVPEDCYFMMGDNRNTSNDSRFWKDKYVHKDKIIGKVKFKYYPGFEEIN